MASVLCAATTPSIAQTPTCTANAAAFGFGSHRVVGARPLLVVLVDFAGSPLAATRNEAYYDRLIFGRGSDGTPVSGPNVIGAFTAASNSAFRFTRAGFARVSFPMPESSITDLRAYDAAMTQAVARVIPLHSFDRNRDRVIDNTELAVVRVANSPASRGGGQTRDHKTTFTAAGGAGVFTFAGDTSNIDQEGDVNLIAHELFHGLGFPDHIYGPGAGLNFRASWFAASFAVAQSPGPIGLDPYHRIRAGWATPRLVSMATTGSALLAIYGQGEASAPIVFYDPDRCGREFFVAEFRNPSHFLAPMDAGAFGSGVYLWYVKPATDHALTLIDWPPPIRGPYSGSGPQAVTNYLVSPGGPGTSRALVSTMPEFSPTWGDGGPTEFGLETSFSPTGPNAALQWRRPSAPFVARIQTINGAPTPVPLDAGRDAPIVLDGVFPARGDGIAARLVSLTSAHPLRIQSYTSTRITLLKQGSVPAGGYLVELSRAAPREVITRGRTNIEFR